MMDEFGQKLTALEAKHQQKIAELLAKIKYAKNNQQQQPATANCQTPDSDCVVVDMDMDMEESPASLIPPPPIAPNLVPFHSAVRATSTCTCNIEIRKRNSPKHERSNTADMPNVNQMLIVVQNLEQIYRE
jgi:hypothetical protein